MQNVGDPNQPNNTDEKVVWEHIDPSKQSYMETKGDGSINYGNDAFVELDPLGSKVGFANPYGEPENLPSGLSGNNWGDPYGGYKCLIDGFQRSCSDTAMYLSLNVAEFDRSLTSSWMLAQFGYWADENDPNYKPTKELDEDGESVLHIGILSVFHQVNLLTSFKNDLATVRRELGNILAFEYDDFLPLDLQRRDEDKNLCQDKILDPLKTLGFDLRDFLNYLGKGADFIDGNTSKIPAINVFSNNLTIPNATLTVQELFLFARSPTTGANVFNIVTSYTLSQSKLTVFYNPKTAKSSSGLLFHEALHGFDAFLNNGSPGKFDDPGLMTLFGLTGGSDKITEFIDKYCGDFFKNGYDRQGLY